ncbi:hypothetical protein JCGZ_10116 [Jatropha curcas]|uniref:CCHC-type domain-containing protein n=1 Tax=Jatropha curcas TaxID=180498 RepID=A0A067LCT5_JATCU|nr:hypothetical protein JCGZ_10116 [Jatropha curcas]
MTGYKFNQIVASRLGSFGLTGGPGRDVTQIRRVEHEGIHLVCFTCGKYGHSSKNCPSIVNGDKRVEVDVNKDSTTGKLRASRQLPETNGWNRLTKDLVGNVNKAPSLKHNGLRSRFDVLIEDDNGLEIGDDTCGAPLSMDQQHHLHGSKGNRSSTTQQKGSKGGAKHATSKGHASSKRVHEGTSASAVLVGTKNSGTSKPKQTTVERKHTVVIGGINNKEGHKVVVNRDDGAFHLGDSLNYFTQASSMNNSLSQLPAPNIPISSGEGSIVA